MKCPKCNGNMEEGYVNTPINILEGKVKNHPNAQRDLGPAVAYVCKECGYIEFYRKEQE